MSAPAPGGVWPWLGPCSLAVGLLAVAIYFLVLLRRPGLVRLLNGSGLLFTGAALFPLAAMAPRVPGLEATNFEVAVAVLILAALVQIAAALRNRAAWDGEERRSAKAWDGAERRGGAAAWDGTDRRARTGWDGVDRRERGVWDGRDRRGAPHDGETRE